MPSSEYMREWRQTENGQAALRKQKRRDKARRRALAQLAELHSAQFATLLTMHEEILEQEEQDHAK